MVIGIIIVLYIVGIFISLFTGEVDFSSVEEGRTAIHIGIFLLSWGILIPISAKYTNNSFVFKWIFTVEKFLAFGRTGTSSIVFSTSLAVFFGILLLLIGIGAIEKL